jgi:NOL1/NOP2/fmu family ribosome biogenesis protein
MQKSIVNPELAVRYMAGETFAGNESGWTVVTCSDMPLGWGKGTGGIIKNHYPKGLRNSLLRP